MTKQETPRGETQEPPKQVEVKPALEETEVQDREVLDHNEEMLNNGMLSHLSSESFGGNGGYVTINGREYPCGGANGYVETATGRIIIFGNMQDVDPKIRKEYSFISLRVAANFEQENPRKMFFKITEVIYRSPISERGARNIEKSVDEYNKSF
jgi:hypothetical protein